MKPLTSLLAAGALALVAGTTFVHAKIVRLDLEGMVTATDDAVLGTIVDRNVFRVDHPIDGPELYYTTLTVEGESLRTGQDRRVDVTFHGGFIDADNGVWNSEAPHASEIELGDEILVFSAWLDNLGGDVAANALYASHGGLYTTFEGSEGVVVQGRGEGYAIPQNVPVARLRTDIQRFAEAQQK